MTWNGTMFDDLDWSLNASRWFISISWASCVIHVHCVIPFVCNYVYRVSQSIATGVRDKSNATESRITVHNTWWHWWPGIDGPNVKGEGQGWKCVIVRCGQWLSCVFTQPVYVRFLSGFYVLFLSCKIQFKSSLIDCRDSPLESPVVFLSATINSHITEGS